MVNLSLRTYGGYYTQLVEPCIWLLLTAGDEIHESTCWPVIMAGYAKMQQEYFPWE